MRKSLLFVMNGMLCGGVERAFLSSLSLIDSGKYDVTCVLLRRYGALLDDIPRWVRVVECPFDAIDRYEADNGRKPALLYALRTGHFLRALEMVVFRMGWALFNRQTPFNCLRDMKLCKRACKNFPEVLRADFDLVLAYGGMARVAALSLHFKAPKRHVWFHLESQPKYESPYYFPALYAKFDRRLCCSRKLAEQLNDFYDPNGRTFEAFPYYLNPGLYHALSEADAGFDDDFDGCRILSVGRLAEQKGFDMAIAVCAGLKKRGFRIRWYVIGEGRERDKLEAQIAKAGLERDFILLGLKTNPYPYFKQCDIYVQPSRWEGYCLTVAEARVFNRPIVCTDFAGASEQIKSGKTGLIVPEISVRAIVIGLRQLLEDRTLAESFSKGLKEESADNFKSVRQQWAELLAT